MSPTVSRGSLAPGSSLVVGRDAAANIVLDTPNVSRLHALIERASLEHWFVTDLGSRNGTWLNGHRLEAKERTAVLPDDDLRLGPHPIDLSRLALGVHAAGSGVHLDVRGLSRSVGRANHRVVDQVGFTAVPGEMVAIMGPSGAGKTSLLSTLAGSTPPSSGHVLLDGLSFYKHHELFRRAVGYVPQEDVMHRSLTAEEVLFFQGRLSFPPEITDDELRARVARTLDRLELDEVADQIVGDEVRRGLSGGQRKRLNVAMELLGEPALLLLDEPTSGLDARAAMGLIRQCRRLAAEGRTVLMTLHQPRVEAFALFDKVLLLAKGGKVAYFGPPGGVADYFATRTNLPASTAVNPADYALDALDPDEAKHRRSPSEWQQDYRRSKDREGNVTARRWAKSRKDARKQARERKPPKAGFLRQTAVLVRRQVRLTLRDRYGLAVQLAQAPIIGVLSVLLFGRARFDPRFFKDDITPALFVLVAAAVWFGCNNVCREIVGDRAVLARERRGALRPTAYLASKVVVGGVLVAAQVLALLAVLVPVLDLQGAGWALVGVPLLAGWCSMTMGLLISAVARTEVHAIGLVPLVILPQIMLSGVLLPVTGERASAASSLLSNLAPLRWAYGAMLQTEFAAETARGMATRSPIVTFWSRVGFATDQLSVNLLVLVGLSVVCVVCAWAVIRRSPVR
ncbi:MAG: ATP-binding cassette domain-containing protein [Deltaproteobacteria bacterium]|nr:ATP-binding cassette domain-containing protein [Deltaproteobacteria bacterium]